MRIETAAPGPGVTRFAIDANAFRKIKFIEFLAGNKDRFHVHVPTLVFLEVGYFFLSKGLPWDRYVSEIGKFNGIMVEWGTIDAKAVVETALSLKATMPFRENVRDFIIGTQCNQLDLFLITYNTHHFEWCKHAPITPEDFILSC